MITYRCNLCRVELPESVNGPLFPIKWGTGKRLSVEPGANAHLCLDCIIAVQVLAKSEKFATTVTIS